MHIDPCQTCLLYLQKLDTLPDTGIRDPGAPVPSEHIMCFSDLGEAPHRVFRSEDPGIGFVLLCNIIYG